MAIPNIQRQSVSWLIAEFFVVVLGVGVALTADSWREEINDRSVESDYLDRLVIDLSQDVESVGEELEAFQAASESANAIIEFLENENHQPDKAQLVEHFTLAAMTSANSSERLRNSTTYSELVSTGNLNLIRDVELRTRINSYYSQINFFIERKNEMTTTIWEIYRMLTGQNAGFLRAIGQLPTGTVADRLIMELETNASIVKDFRLLRANLSNFVNGYPRVIADAESLIGEIRNR